jgi:hypothetical protein
MSRSTRFALTVLAAAACSCWSEACIDADTHMCFDTMGSPWADQQQPLAGVNCDVELPFTTCHDLGYTCPCGVGAWCQGNC